MSSPHPNQGSIADASYEVPERGVILYWPPHRLTSARAQPRTQFEDGAVEELASNIALLREDDGGIRGTGILQPILARLPSGSLDIAGRLKRAEDVQFPITAGETRWRAASMLVDPGLVLYDRPGGRHVQIPDLVVPVLIEDVTEDAAYELGFYENFVRHNLKSKDTARALRHMMNRRGWSIRDAAREVLGDVRKFGMISNILDVLKMGEDVQVLIDTNSKKFSHAQRIDRVKDPALRKRLIELTLEGKPYSDIINLIRHARDPSTKDDVVSSHERPDGTRRVAGFNLDEAFESVIKNASHVRDELPKIDMGPLLRRQLRPHVAALRNIVNDLEKSVYGAQEEPEESDQDFEIIEGEPKGEPKDEPAKATAHQGANQGPKERK